MRISFVVSACIGATAVTLDVKSFNRQKDSQDISYSPYEQLFYGAQGEATTGETCLTAQERAKTKPAEGNDFYTIRNKEIKDDVKAFEDTDFGHTDDSICWKDLGECEDGAKQPTKLSKIAKESTWKRAFSQFKKQSLFGTDGVTFDDIKQGQLGNCWFLAAATAVADKIPKSIESMFLGTTDGELNEQGIYAVNLYALGVPHTVIIDDWLPLKKEPQDYIYTTVFAKVSDDQALWGPLIEKAFAKLHGNYSHIESGHSSQALRTLTGSPTITIKHDNKEPEHHLEDGKEADFVPKSVEDRINALWDKILNRDDSSLFVGGTPSPPNAETKKNTDGLYYSHVYVVMETLVLPYGQRLVKIRNPHGAESYNGTWSDNSRAWRQLRRQIRKDNKANKDSPEKEQIDFDTREYQKRDNDGNFWMQIEDYYEQMEDTVESFKTKDWASAKFLKLDDKSVEENPGRYSWCGDKCTRHTLNLKSSVKQTVWISAQTWPDRCQAKSCDIEKEHSVLFTGSTYVNKINNTGAYSFEPKELEADTDYMIITEWDFRHENTAKDWSVTAWAKEGTLTLSHQDGKTESDDSLPFVARTVDDDVYEQEVKEADK